MIVSKRCSEAIPDKPAKRSAVDATTSRSTMEFGFGCNCDFAKETVRHLRERIYSRAGKTVFHAESVPRCLTPKVGEDNLRAIAIAGLLVYRTAVTSNVSAGVLGQTQDMIVNSGLNTDGGDANDGIIESSVTFLANTSMQKIMANMFNPGTLSKIAPDHVLVKTVTKGDETADAITYKAEEVITPFNVPFVQMSPTSVHLVFNVNKRALADRMVYVTFNLDPDPAVKNDWDHLSGRICAIDLHNGNTMCMVCTSTKSKFHMPNTIRQKLATMYLAKAKDHVVNWLNSLQ